MAFARVSHAAVRSGRMPRVCMCCGSQAEQLVEHRFYYDPVSLMVLSLVLPRLARRRSGYDTVEMSVPLCGSHQHRFRLMSILGYAMAGVALLFVPLMIYFTYTKQAAAQGWMAVILILVVGALLAAMLALRLFSPRLVEIRGDMLGFTGVSNEFAGAFGGGAAPTGGFRAKELLIALGVGGGALAVLLIVGLIAKLWSDSTRKRDTDAFFAESKAKHDQFVAEHQAHVASGKGGPFVPSQMQPPVQGGATSPPIDPAEEHRRIASMSGEERRAYFQQKFGPKIPPGSNTTVTAPIPTIAPPVVAPPPVVTNETTPKPVTSTTTVGGPMPSTLAPTPKAQRGQPRQQVAAVGFGSTEVTPPSMCVIVPPATRLPVGEEVWSLWGSLWYPATVVEANAEGVKVHYAGYADAFDEVKEWKDVAIDTAILAELTPPAEVATPTSPLPVAEHAVRQWVDVTGKFKIEGKLVKLENGKVTILKSDGKEITVPLEKLSAADQEYLSVSLSKP